MTQTLQDTLTEILRDVFDDETIVAQDGLTAGDVDGWDSLTHIRLLLTVERRFQTHFTASDIAGLKTVGDLAELIQRRLPGGHY
jgi:acyl carrier protein